MSRRRKQFSLSTPIILTISFLAIIFLFIGRGTSEFTDFGSFTQNTLPNLELVIFLVAFILFIFGGLIIFFNNYNKKLELKAIDLSGIDKMTGIEFEKYVGELLKSRGFKISLTSTSHDYGVDIIASKDGDKIAVQLKKYSKLVGRSAISDAVAGMAHYKCNKTMVITNNYFTKEAKALAQSNNCKLIDRDKLSEWIYNFKNI